MRLSYSEISRMRHNILTDMYGSKEKKIEERKTNIAQQNRDLWLEKYQSLLAQLPEAMVSRHKDYQ